MSASYSSPVSGLLTFGDCRNLRGWPDYPDVVGLGPEHVPELIRMATDEDLNWADPEGLEVWAPVHAWRALGQLRATEAIEPLLRLFHELEDVDWATDELPQVYGMIGREAIPALARYLDDASRGLYPRVSAAFSLERVAAGDPSTRDECVAILKRQLAWFAEEDPTLNAFLVNYLIDLRAVEAAPLMERAFAADSIDISVPGDWEDVQVELGLKAHRETPRPSYLTFRHPMLEEPVFGAPEPDAPEPDAPLRVSSTDRAAGKARARRKQAKSSRKKNRKRR